MDVSVSKSPQDRHAAEILRLTDNFERLSQFSCPPTEASTASLEDPHTVRAPQHANQLEDFLEDNRVVVEDASTCTETASETETDPSHPYGFGPRTIIQPTEPSFLQTIPSMTPSIEDVRSDITTSDIFSSTAYYSSDRRHIALLEKQMAKLTDLYEQQAELLSRTQSQNQPRPFLPQEPLRYYPASFPSYGPPLPIEYFYPTQSYPAAFMAHPHQQAIERTTQGVSVYPTQPSSLQQFLGNFPDLPLNSFDRPQQLQQQGSSRRTTGTLPEQEEMPQPVQHSPYPLNTRPSERIAAPVNTVFKYQDGLYMNAPGIPRGHTAFQPIQTQPQQPGHSFRVPSSAVNLQQSTVNSSQSNYSPENHQPEVSPKMSPSLQTHLEQETLEKTISQAVYSFMSKNHPELSVIAHINSQSNSETLKKSSTQADHGIVLETHPRLSTLQESSEDESETQDSYLGALPHKHAVHDSILYRVEREAAKRLQSETSSLSPRTRSRPDPPCADPSPLMFVHIPRDPSPALSEASSVESENSHDGLKQLEGSRREAARNVTIRRASSGIHGSAGADRFTREEAEEKSGISQIPPSTGKIETSLRNVSAQSTSLEITSTGNTSTQNTSTGPVSQPQQEGMPTAFSSSGLCRQPNTVEATPSQPGAYRLSFGGTAGESDIEDDSSDVSPIEEALITAQVVNETVEEERRNEINQQLHELRELRSDLERQRATVVHAEQVHVERLPRRRPWWRRLWSNRKKK